MSVANDVMKIIINMDSSEYNSFMELLKIEISNRRNKETMKIKSTLSVGDRVKVNGKRLNSIGIIKKVNRTRCVVDVSGREWNVPMSIMTKV